MDDKFRVAGRVAVDEVPPVGGLLDFRGKVVLVTGAGRGIGPGIALRFAEAGARVVVNYRESRKGAEAVVAQIEAAGGEAFAERADVTRTKDVAGLFHRCDEAFGRLDVLINNAGLYPESALLEMSEADWDAVVEANLRSVFLCTQAAARRMIARGSGGAIVNIASIEAANPRTGPLALRRGEGRGDRAHARRGAGAGPARDPRERRLTRADLERRDRAGLAGRGTALARQRAARTDGHARGCRRRLPVPRLARRTLDHRRQSCRGRRRDGEATFEASAVPLRPKPPRVHPLRGGAR